MNLTQLEIEQFRCHARVHLSVPESGIRIVGQNASGKTSLLEAVGMLATTRSLRGAADRDLVKWDSGEDYGIAPFTRIDATIESEGIEHRLGISMELADDGDAVQQKKFFLDSQATTAHGLVGNLRAVMFTPEDVQLVIGPPANRRRVLDVLISQLDRTYMRQLAAYGKVLRQRNSLLRSFSRDRVQPTASAAITQLSFWDEQLVASGGYLIARRARTIDTLNAAMRRQSIRLSAADQLGIAYVPRTSGNANVIGPHMSISDAVVNSNVALQHDLEAHRVEEFRRGMTLTGPHRDDVLFEIRDRSLARFGSRGEQRLGVLALKLAEADVIEDESGEAPVFLLDDILSELDAAHRAMLLDNLASHAAQIIITTAEESAFNHESLKDLDIYRTHGAEGV